MLKKNTKAQRGPTWFEVGLGAFLSVALGAVLGAAYMVSRPVLKVTAIPKDAPASAIYYIEGSRGSANSSSIAEKRKSFVGGESISVEEGELNALIGSVSQPEAPKPKAAKPGEKPPPPPPANQRMIDAGTLNARMHGGKIQFGDTVTFNVYGFSFSVIVQATGTFTRRASGFEFDPESSYVGGCPVQRLLFVRGFAMKKLLFAQPAPDDLAAAWAKLADVSIEGSTLRLKMP
jgi:hypothetical protein